MTKRHRQLLARLDPVGLKRYQITEGDVRTVEKYVSIIQADLKGDSVWDDCLHYSRIPQGIYATSILIHEISELRELARQGLDLRLRRQTQHQLRTFLGQHIQAHVMGLYEEHVYLQEAISRVLGEHFEVATLVQANCSERDLEFFLESEVGIFLLEGEQRLEAAKQILAELKGERS